MPAARELGLTVDHPWGAMVAALAVGVAVGLQAPLRAPLLVAELLVTSP